MPEDEELYRRIDEVSHYIWDPIGVSDVPEARDEYHSYVPELYARTKIGDVATIIEYMEWVVVERMEMIFDRARAEKAAQIMIAWKETIDEHG